MSPYNPGTSTAGTAQPPTPDTQTLIGLLGSMMPLLLQIQSQSREQIFQPGSIQPGLWQPGLFQSEPGQPSPGQHNSNPTSHGGLFGNVAPANPMLDHQAAVNLVEDMTADSLRMLSGYLETYADQHPGLEVCVPIVTQGARCFAARDYAQTLGLIWETYRMITTLRAGNPQLPPLRGLAEASFSPASTNTAIH